MEIQHKANCKEGLLAEKNELLHKLSEETKLFESIYSSQKTEFEELMSKYVSLSQDYDKKEKQLTQIDQENTHMWCENEQYDEKYEELTNTREKLSCVITGHLEKATSLKKQNSDLSKIEKELQDKLRVADSKLRGINDDIICNQNKLTEKINEQTELEKRVNKEQEKNDNSVSSINAIKLKIEKLNKTFQVESAEQQNLLNDRSDDLAKIKQDIKDKQEEIETQKNRFTDLQTEINTLRENHTKEKDILEKKVCERKSDINTLTSKLTSNNKQLSELQIENTVLKNHLIDQDEVIKISESTIVKLEQKLNRIKESSDSVESTIKSVQEQHTKNKQNVEIELLEKANEICEIQRLIQDQMEKITELENLTVQTEIEKFLSDKEMIESGTFELKKLVLTMLKEEEELIN